MRPEDQFLAFNTEGNEYNPISRGGVDFFYGQIQLNMHGTADFYYMSFDILTKKLISSRNSFSIFAAQKISFLNSGNINISEEVDVPYNDNQQLLFEIHVDYVKNEILYFVNKKKVHISKVRGNSGMDDIRFSLGLLHGDKKSDDTSFVGLDNIYTSDTIPIEQDQLLSSQKVDQSQTQYKYVADLSSDGKAGRPLQRIFRDGLPEFVYWYRAVEVRSREALLAVIYALICGDFTQWSDLA